MSAEITVIIDNIPGDGLSGEWGLCFLVNYNGRKIMVDAGGSDLFLRNMEALGEDPSEVEYAVLSHAHYDHANGMPAFFRHNSRAKLYVREGTAADCYHRIFIFRKYIGIPRDMMETFADRIESVRGVFPLTEGAWLVPHTTAGLSSIGRREKMFRRIEGRWVPDDFSHEQSLVLDTEKGLVIINSCSHGGVVNTVDEVRAAFPGKHVYGYIGGFHLFNKTESEIDAVADALKGISVDYICTGHCTKERAYAILAGRLGERIEQLHSGLRIEI